MKDQSFPSNMLLKNKWQEIQQLDSKKACQEKDLPVKLIKENLHIILTFIDSSSNNSV